MNWQNVTVTLGDLKPWERNPKTISKAHAKRLLEYWSRIGQFQSIAIGPGGEVYDGHQRLSVLLAAYGPGYQIDARQSEVALTDEERQELVIAAHVGTTGQFSWDELSGWDAQQLQEWGMDAETLASWRADATALTEMLEAAKEQPAEDPGAQIDKADELREKWGVETGQLWQLGEHRIICGDCTDRAVISRLLNGDKVSAVVTDPPYGVGVDYGEFQDTPENVVDLIGRFMPIMLDYPCIALTPGVPAMWSYPKPVWVGAWVHPAPVGGCPWGFVGNNPILYYGADPYLKAGKGRRSDSIVMASDRQGVEGHPAPKPLKVWDWLVERLTPNIGDIVLEPFNGSGTTIISCERLGRVCRAIELDPAYVAVSIQRWVDMTGGVPELIQ